MKSPLDRITEVGVVAVVRARDAHTALSIADACRRGGIEAIEITFTVPGAPALMEELNRQAGDELLIGAGTVLDAQTARIALLSGARFIVTPYLRRDVMELCHRYRVPCLPGAMTVREVGEALELGAELIKVFPGEVVGPKFIKAVHGPLPQAAMMPTGGVDVDNVGDWIRAGAVAVGAGGSLTKGAEDGQFDAIAQRAELFVARVREARA